MVLEITDPILFDANENPPALDGQRLLRSVASRLRGGVSELDTVGRLNGARFAIIASQQTANENLAILAVHLQQSFNYPVDRGGVHVDVTAAMGISIYPSDSRSAEQLLSNALSAVERAKVEPGLAMSFVTQAQTDQVQSSLIDGKDLRDAMAHNELKIRRLPRQRLKDGALTGYAIDIYWDRGELGVWGYDQIFHIAETTGLSAELTIWAVNAIQRTEIEDITAAPLPVSIAMDSKRLTNLGVMAAITSPMETGAEHLVPLELDLRSGMLSHLDEAGRAQLARLPNHDVTLNLNGLCDGVMHPERLAMFGFKRMKISAAMVANALADPTQERVLRTITKVAHGLDITTVAVNLPHDHDPESLKELGFTEIQMASALPTER
jgi:predicted signal transduction protein with EAL and GGDEF domain